MGAQLWTGGELGAAASMKFEDVKHLLTDMWMSPAVLRRAPLPRQTAVDSNEVSGEMQLNWDIVRAIERQKEWVGDRPLPQGQSTTDIGEINNIELKKNSAENKSVVQRLESLGAFYQAPALATGWHFDGGVGTFLPIQGKRGFSFPSLVAQDGKYKLHETSQLTKAGDSASYFEFSDEESDKDNVAYSATDK
jgi:hypothetical protein